MRITIPHRALRFEMNLKTSATEKLKALHITKDYVIISDSKSLLKVNCKNAELENEALNIDFLELKKFLGKQKKDMYIEIEKMNEDSVFIAFHDKKGMKKGIIKRYKSYIDYTPIVAVEKKDYMRFNLCTSFSKLECFKTLKVLEIGKEAIQARLQHIRARVIMQENKRLELEKSFYLAFQRLNGIDTNEGATWYIKAPSKNEGYKIENGRGSTMPFYIEQGNTLLVTMPHII